MRRTVSCPSRKRNARDWKDSPVARNLKRDTSSNLSQENSGETTQATESLADLESQTSSPMTVRSDTPPPQAPVVPYKRPQKRKRTASPGNDVDTEKLKSLQLQQPECLDDDDMWARSIVLSVRSLNHLLMI
ncbi:hypothetical protein ElyMa_006652400 [Elysia marginata]|uniref:BESS domain-containing protein n=1 Tax=Elysia marginata TaxID=1093978 RepID=A0AAV4IJK5_9GAST|nr:hypothetical protein ElyMa_006652400 [Elysia marginata]